MVQRGILNEVVETRKKEREEGNKGYIIQND